MSYNRARTCIRLIATTPTDVGGIANAEEAAQVVEMWGARPWATAHVRATPALLSPPRRPAALVT
jgi:hypothetical protein